MNRIQFTVVTALAAFLALLVILDITLAHKVAYQQGELSQAQQALQQYQQLANNLHMLLNRLSADVQKTGDQGIKDLLARQQITFKPNDGVNTNSTENPAAPASPSTTTH